MKLRTAVFLAAVAKGETACPLISRARATELLERSRRPIKQIAAAVGFRNEKSFARAFAGWTGVAPSAWREGVRR